MELQLYSWLEEHILEELKRLGMGEATSPVLLQNFEISSLEYVASKSSLRQVFINTNNLTELDWLRLDSLSLKGAFKNKFVKIDILCKTPSQVWEWARTIW